jgi:hypothetical protein
MDSEAVLEVEVRYLDGDSSWVTGPLSGVGAEALMVGRPVRRFPTHAGQRNYPGLLWTATTGSLVGYESLLERDRLWLADFDQAVTGIASQPFWVSGRDGEVLRRHVPDFMLRVGSGYRVVDVKPERMATDRLVSAVFDWTGRLCAAKGWAYEVWTGADPVLLRNVRFLGAARRRLGIEEGTLGKVAGVLRPGMSVAEVERAAGLDAVTARAAVLTLLWRGRWVTDLTRPLSAGSTLDTGERAA